MKTQPAFKTVLLLAFGIVLGKTALFRMPCLICLSLFLSGVLLFLFRNRKRKYALQIILGFVLILAGFSRYKQSTLLPENHISRFSQYPEAVELRAFLIRDPIEKTGKIELLVESEAVAMADTIKPVCGKVLIPFYESSSCSLHYGDEIIIQGRLEKPRGLRNPGGFDYHAYLELRSIYSILKPADSIQTIRKTGTRKGNGLQRKTVYPIRRNILKILSNTTDAETRPILKALIVGDQGCIPDDVRQGFSRSGAVHILSVSGSHVGFVLLILTTVFEMLRLPRLIRIIMIILGAIFYCLTAEANAPVVRATLMAVIYLIGSLAERKMDPYNIVGAAALVCLLLAPRDLFDLSFQLSYASVLSILFFYRRLKNLGPVKRAEARLAGHSVGRIAMSAVLVSIAAQIGTFPLIAFYFNQIPILSIFANLIAIPLSGLIVALGFTTFLIAPVHFATAAVYGTLNQTLLKLFIGSVVWIGNLPFSHVTVPSPSGLNLFAYAAGILFMVYFRRPFWRKAAVWILLVSAGAGVWKGILNKEYRQLTWIQFDVGQGDAALFCLPCGKNLLVDGGDKTPYWDSGESVIAPYLRKAGIRKLNGIVLTHPHDDHIGGLISVIEQFKVERIFTAGDSFSSPIYSKLSAVIQKKKIPIRVIRAPDSLTDLRGVKIYFLWPKNPERFKNDNDRSLVMRVLYGNQKWLLMGDAGMSAEKALVSSGVSLKSDVVKIGHHGSKTSTSEAFLRQVRPKTAVISVGKGNRFGHPSDAVLLCLERNGVSVCRTDFSGAVVFRTDGIKTKRLRDYGTLGR